MRGASIALGGVLLGAGAFVHLQYVGDVKQSLRQAQTELSALKAELVQRESAERARETVFQAYVASTQRHAQSENARIIAGLFDMGLSPAEALDVVGEAQPAGGVDRSLDLEAAGPGSELATCLGLSPEPAIVDAEGAGASDVAAIDAGMTDTFGLNDNLRAFLAAVPASDPMLDARTTSQFGVRRHPISRRLGAHVGTDLVSSSDPSVRAAGGGRVAFAGWHGGYGNMVVIEHPLGFETRYAHLSRMMVRAGEEVSGAQRIGIMGNTGYSSGAHLHFELRFRGRPLDALKALSVAREHGSAAPAAPAPPAL